MEINQLNLVRIFKIVKENEKFYILEEFITGKTLEEIIENNSELPDAFIKNVMTSLCDGLYELHKNGIVHRDISPKNVMVNKFGIIKIIDYGIARKIKAGQSKDTEILGTQGYAAPEQSGFYQTSNKADIYALGVLLNVMKTGELPNKKLADAPYKSVVLKCTMMDENDRYKSVLELKKCFSRKNTAFSVDFIIPQFSSNYLAVKIASIATFIFIVLAFLTFFVPPTHTNTGELISNITFLIFILIVPYFLVYDYNNYLEKWRFTRDKPLYKKVLIVLALVSLSLFVFGVLTLFYD